MQAKAILHLADLHLGAPPPAKLREIAPDLADRFAASRDQLLVRLARWITTPPFSRGACVGGRGSFRSSCPAARSLWTRSTGRLPPFRLRGSPSSLFRETMMNTAIPKGCFGSGNGPDLWSPTPRLRKSIVCRQGSYSPGRWLFFRHVTRQGEATPGQLVDYHFGSGRLHLSCAFACHFGRPRLSSQRIGGERADIPGAAGSCCPERLSLLGPGTHPPVRTVAERTDDSCLSGAAGGTDTTRCRHRPTDAVDRGPGSGLGWGSGSG